MSKCWYCHNDLTKNSKYSFLKKLHLIIETPSNNYEIHNNEGVYFKFGNKNDILNVKYQNTKKRKSNHKVCTWLCIPLFLNQYSKNKLHKYKCDIQICRKKYIEQKKEKRKNNNINTTFKIFPSEEIQSKSINATLNIYPPTSLGFERGIGMFCSFPCIWAYIRDRIPFCTSPSILKEAERCVALVLRQTILINLIDSKVYIPPLLKIFPYPAPPIHKLKEYGGTLSRTSYNEKLYILMKECLSRYWGNVIYVEEFIQACNTKKYRLHNHIKIDNFCSNALPITNNISTTTTVSNNEEKKQVFNNKKRNIDLTSAAMSATIPLIAKKTRRINEDTKHQPKSSTLLNNNQFGFYSIRRSNFCNINKFLR